MKKLALLAGIFLIYCVNTSCIYETPYWTPDGKKLLLGALYKDDKGEDQYQFFLVDVESGKSSQVSQFLPEKSGVNPTLSPDGTKITYYYHEEEMPEDKMELRVMSLSGGDSKKILDLTKENERYHYTTNPWDPNGQRLVIQNFNPQKKSYEILVTDLNGVSKNLTEEVPGILPSWSPDGKQIAFITLGKNDYDLVLSNTEELSSKTVTSSIALPKKHREHVMQYLAPSWSPDGKKMAYVSGQQIATVDLETGEKRELTSGFAYKIFPRWSPDGKWIAFNKVRFKKKEPMYGESRVELFIIDPEGKNPKILTYLKGETYLPQWSPTGDRLAFMFARENEVSFLPGIVDLTGNVKFFPINGDQKIGLAKYYLGHDESKVEYAQNLLKEVIQESPKTKWAEEAQKLLTAIEDQKKESESVLKSSS